MAFKKDFKDYEERELSVFNMSVASLIRIDKLLTACAIACAKRDLSKWFSVLTALSLQVKYSFENSEDDNENEYKINKKLFEEICRYQAEYEKYEAMGKIRDFKDFSKYFNALDRYETFIRKALDRRGMIMKMASSEYEEWET